MARNMCQNTSPQAFTNQSHRSVVGAYSAKVALGLVSVTVENSLLG